MEQVLEAVCQCPTSGLSHFYTEDDSDVVYVLYCVNALHRAYPISTVPFKKPYKINGFRDGFQGVIVRKF